MRRAARLSAMLAALLAWLPLSGCSDDPSSPPDGPAPPTGYQVRVWLGTPPTLFGCEARIVRLNPADSSAASAEITVNGTAIPLRPSSSGPDTACFALAAFAYVPQTGYVVAVALPDSSDTCRFTAVALPAATLDSPENGDEFTPGQPIELLWSYRGDPPDSVYLLAETDFSSTWVPLPGEDTTHAFPGTLTAGWEESDVYLTLGVGRILGSFSGALATADSYVGARVRGSQDECVLSAGEPLPPGVPLSEAIAAAPEGEARGHLFAHLVVLDGELTYTGGATIHDDTCIQGNGARIDLAGESIVVAPPAQGIHTRCDIDHCLLLNGGIGPTATYGGALEYKEASCGWVVNNTFYGNYPHGLYMNEMHTAGDALKVINNIFYGNGWGLVRNENQPDLYIRHNDSFRSMGGGNYGEHTGCTSCAPVAIFPDGAALHASNRIEDPGFVQNPSPPKLPGDFHLRSDSPCIGTGEDPLTGTAGGVDKGAFPYQGAADL